jgi:excisionase family DNA binding protein
LNLQEKVVRTHQALLNGSGEIAYFTERRIAEQTVKCAYLGYENGAFLYPCRAKSGSLLALHYKSKARGQKGKRLQWWGGYANDLPSKGHGKRTWLTVPETAHELHIPRTRCYELIQQGSLPTVRIGKRSIRVNRHELERFLLETRCVVVQ